MPIRLCYSIGLFKVADHDRPEKKLECLLKVRTLLSAIVTANHSAVRVVFLKELLRDILAYCPTRNTFYFGKLYLAHLKYSLHLNPLRGYTATRLLKNVPSLTCLPISFNWAR